MYVCGLVSGAGLTLWSSHLPSPDPIPTTPWTLTLVGCLVLASRCGGVPACMQALLKARMQEQFTQQQAELLAKIQALETGGPAGAGAAKPASGRPA